MSATTTSEAELVIRSGATVTTAAQRWFQNRIGLSTIQTVGDAPETITAGTTTARLGTSLSAPRIFTLPNPAAYADGATLIFTDATGSLTTVNTVTLTAGAGTVNGAATMVLTTPYASPVLISNGVDKWILDTRGITRGGTGATTAAGARTNLGLGTADSVAFTDLTLGTSGKISGGANLLEQRNSTNAQAFRVYNTFPGSNNEWGGFDWQTTANTLRIGTDKAASGLARAIDIVLGGTARWQISTAGHILGSADNAYDIGASTANRLRAGYFGTLVAAGLAAPGVAAGLSSLTSMGSNWALIGGNSVTDATNKQTRIGGLHYLASEEPVTAVYAFSTLSATSILIGGGTGLGNSATIIEFYTAADNVTLTGTSRWNINSAGNFLASTDNTYDIGASGASRPKDIFAAGMVAANFMSITDGITAPGASAGRARIYVDSADGELKVIFGDGIIKTIVLDT